MKSIIENNFKPILWLIKPGQEQFKRLDWIRVFNSSLGYHSVKEEYSIDELDNYIIESINSNYSAVFVRHGFQEDIIKMFTVPVFAQHEFPYGYLNCLSSKLIYLTDISYLNYFPKSEVHCDFFKGGGGSLEGRFYDIIFVGTLGKRTFNPSLHIRIFMTFLKRNYLNFFGSTEALFESFKNKFIPYKIYSKLKSFETLKMLEWRLQHSIREERRRRVLQELAVLSNQGVKVAVATNHESKKDEIFKGFNKNVDFYYDLDFESELPELFKKAIMVVVSTPFHQSIINERFFLALENGAIPLVEEYPQYAKFYRKEPGILFDYKSKPLSEVARGLLKKDSKSINQINEGFIKIAKKDFSAEELVNYLKRLIMKYQN